MFLGEIKSVRQIYIFALIAFPVMVGIFYVLYRERAQSIFIPFGAVGGVVIGAFQALKRREKKREPEGIAD